MDKRYYELVSLLKKDHGLFYSKLYKNLMYIENKQSSFNDGDLKKIYIAYALLTNNKAGNLEELNSNIDILMLSPKLEGVVKNFKNTYEKEEWVQFEKNVPDKLTHKLYMSVDNSSLCYVGLNLLQECLKRNRDDFSFKLSLKESVNRRDNLVVYCNEENLSFYHNLLKKVSYNATINEPHLLAHDLGNNIYGGYDYENGTVSYAEKHSDDMHNKLSKSLTPEEIAMDFYINLNKNEDMQNIIENGDHLGETFNRNIRTR